MPDGFTQAFAIRLDRASRLSVTEVTTDILVKPNNVYVAKSGSHMEVANRNRKILVEPTYGPKYQGHKPSATITLRSLAKIYHPELMCTIILSGMGHDGAEAAAELHEKGSLVLPQNKETSVVYGMPRSFVERVGNARTYYPEQISAILSVITKPKSQRDYSKLSFPFKSETLNKLNRS